MSEPIYEFRFQRGSADRWTALNPILGPGEPGVEIDTGRLKIGDGNTAWNSLSYYMTEPYTLALVNTRLDETGGLSADPRVGDLSDLTTSDKATIVAAINEIDNKLVYIPFGRANTLAVFTGPRLYMPDDTELVEAVFSLNTAPVGSPATFQVLKNGVNVFAIDPQIEPSSFVSTPGVLSGTTTFAAWTDYVQVRCSQVGSTTPGSDLTASLKMRIA